MKVEVYYGYYEGDSQVWDTIYMDIPKEKQEEFIDEEDINNYATHEAFLELSKTDLTIAFMGVLSIEEEKEDI